MRTKSDLGRWLCGFLLSVLLLAGCSQEDQMAEPADVSPEVQQQNDLLYVDNYLAAMDKAVKEEPVAGQSKFMELKKVDETFELSLIRMLNRKDPRAPSRFVFSQVVQFGHYLSSDTQLGKAALKMLGMDFPLTVKPDGMYIFAGDVYKWWRRDGHKYEQFNLLSGWEQTNFAKQVAIPLYLGTNDQPGDTAVKP